MIKSLPRLLENKQAASGSKAILVGRICQFEEQRFNERSLGLLKGVEIGKLRFESLKAQLLENDASSSSSLVSRSQQSAIKHNDSVMSRNESIDYWVENILLDFIRAKGVRVSSRDLGRHLVTHVTEDGVNAHKYVKETYDSIKSYIGTRPGKFVVFSDDDTGGRKNRKEYFIGLPSM